MVMSDETFREIQTEWQTAVKDIVAGLPDRSDLMMPLARILGRGEEDRPSMAECLKAAAKATKKRPEKIRGSNQTKPYTMARMLSCYLMREFSNKTFVQIGRFLGRDHTTVIHAVRRAESLMGMDREFMLAYHRALVYLK